MASSSSSQIQNGKSRRSSSSVVNESRQNKGNEIYKDGENEKIENLIDIDVGGSPKREGEKLEIDLFGFRFQTDIPEVVNKSGNENLLKDFMVEKTEKRVKSGGGGEGGDGGGGGADLIQIEIPDSKPMKKFEYVDEKIFSGLDDHSILDNIIKSFSEDDFSYYLEGEKEKNITSDSGLEVCLSGSDVDVCLKINNKRDFPNDCWSENNVVEKVELKTLQQIFDRSFSSNLSSPRGSTSFDDDILSTEHSDEKSHHSTVATTTTTTTSFKNKTKDSRHNGFGQKKMQKSISKNSGMAAGAGASASAADEISKKSSQTVKTSADFIPAKTDSVNFCKKIKRSSSETMKRCKQGRKSKESNVKKEIVKMEKKKMAGNKEFDHHDDVIVVGKINDGLNNKKRDINYKMTDRFDENLIEYNVKNFDVNVNNENGCHVGDSLLVHQTTTDGNGKKIDILDELVADELEETRKLSRKYGLKIPGKGVKADTSNSNNSNGILPPPTPPTTSVVDAISPERCIKVLENHIKHFKPVLDGGPINNKNYCDRESRLKSFRYTRYESFGDPDFGTPV
ncbi:hypothetical protein Phum_PHUM601580 [Pediculus humanus corporis]|uniref:Uncharacterized protein n=1 Tax=Pediculus humanus subsp. corporis TaxID=121224 RepID=E0W362_PEDHC|nr:uncharacterized protein Phum_PHUM601580 [Pediculus humanus corporis]EEB20068.1 hypothetical protein Phum_PHUM601580 [Pediculus humanus corporis]